MNEFYYPKLGAGMLWDKFEDYLVDQNIDIIKGNAAANILKKDQYFEI